MRGIKGIMISGLNKLFIELILKPAVEKYITTPVKIMRIIVAKPHAHFFFKNKRRPAKKKKKLIENRIGKTRLPSGITRIKKEITTNPPPITIIHQAAILVFVGRDGF